MKSLNGIIFLCTFLLQKTLETAVFQIIKLKPCETEVSKGEMLEQAALLDNSIFKRKFGCCSTKHSVETQEENGCVVNTMLF